MKGTDNADQFYWTTTGADGKVYHLEYSDGWSTHMGNNQKADGEYAFVLYEEDRSATDGKLDAAVNAGDMWPGADEDGDNEGNWSNRYKFDNAIMALIFKTVDTYWS